MKLTNCQQTAVRDIFTRYQNAVRHVSFKAPTGSGKTFMACEFIARCFLDANNVGTRICCVVATLSTAQLPEQFARKITNYKPFLSYSKFDVALIKSPSQEKIIDANPKIVAHNQQVIFFGTASFGKKRIFTENNEIDCFLTQIKNEQYKLIYIRDEAHIGSKTSTKLNISPKFSDKLEANADFILKMTATPRAEVDVEMTEQDIQDDGNACQKYLLKTKLQKNKFVTDEAIDNFELAEIVLKQFCKIKQKYQKIGNINPALLIQVSPKFKKNNVEFEANIARLIAQIRASDLNYVKYFADDKDSNLRAPINLGEISKNDSLVDVIIFKNGPAVGWDIPRACVLLQLRNIFSETLNKQTLGRIKRNPHPALEHNEHYEKYYLYSNYNVSNRKMNSFAKKTKYRSDIASQRPCVVRGKIKNYDRISDHWSLTQLEGYLRSQQIMDAITEQINDIIANGTIMVDLHSYGNNKKNTKNWVGFKIINQFELYKYLNCNWPQLWESIGDLVKKIACEKKWCLVIYKYLLLSKYYVRINSLLAMEIEKRKESAEYLIQNNIELENFFEIWESKWQHDGATEKNSRCIDTSQAKYQNYFEKNPYKNITKANTKPKLGAVAKQKDKIAENKMIFDSRTENNFLKKVFQAFKDNDMVFSCVELWFKNASFTNQIYFEYIRNGAIHKSYIDFVFKHGEKYLFVEVKNKKMFDEEKTDILKREYQRYTLISENHDIYLGIYIGDLKDATYDLEIFSNDESENHNTSIQDALLKIV